MLCRVVACSEVGNLEQIHVAHCHAKQCSFELCNVVHCQIMQCYVMHYLVVQCYIVHGCLVKHCKIAKGCPEYISSVVEVSSCSN